MRIAICDDEKEIRDILSRKIKKICSGAEIILYQSGKELLLADTQPDLCLLDIQMSEPNGMETAKEFRKTNKKAILIFVTALDDYVFDAFDVGAFHYLLKPFDDAKFDEVIKSALMQYHENEAALKEESAKCQEYIMVHAGSNFFRTHRAYLVNFKYVEKPQL